MRKYCFTGPSLPHAQAQSIAPEVMLLPPIAHGDLLRLDPQPGDVVLIIDGYYYNQLPVRHKELLDCLARGVILIGASSMGALRAVEMGTCGMRGTGLIHRLYRDGALQGDDEVAVLHAPSDEGFRIVGEALINIRATLRRALRRGVIDAATAQALLSAAERTVFYLRTYDEMAPAAIASGADAAQVAALLERLPQLRVDVKRRDAIRALQLLHRFSEPAAQRPSPVETFHLLEWKRQHSRPDGSSVATGAAATTARLFGRDYPELLVDVMSRWFSAEGVDAPASAESLIATFAREQDIADVGAWLAERGLSRDDLAACLRVREIDAGRRHRGDGENLAGGVGEFARSHGIGTAVLRDVGASQWLTIAERNGLAADEAARRVICRSFRISRALAVPDPVLIELKMSGRYATVVRLAEQIQDFNAALQKRRQSFDSGRLNPDVVTQWFLGQWGSGDDWRGALAERGFRNPTELVEAARPFFLFDRTRGGIDRLDLLSDSRDG